MLARVPEPPSEFSPPFGVFAAALVHEHEMTARLEMVSDDRYGQLIVDNELGQRTMAVAR